MTDPLNIDCHGIDFLDPIEVDCQGQKFRFVFREKDKNGPSFSFGLYINRAACGTNHRRYPRHNRAAMLVESPINVCFQNIDRLIAEYDLILTHQQNLLTRGAPFATLLFGTNWVNIRTRAEAQALIGHQFDKSKQISFMGSIQHPREQAYAFRTDVARYCLTRTEIDCFGKGIRELADKRDALVTYRFSIAMENAASDKYFSEKLVDCFLTDTIPIYFGPPGIGDLFDIRGLLPFQSIEELEQILNHLSVEQYLAMQPFAEANKRKAIELRCESHEGLFERVAESLLAKWGTEKLQRVFRSTHNAPVDLAKNLLRLWFKRFF